MNYKILYIAFASLAFVSCGGEAEGEGDSTDSTANACKYSYDPASTVLTWTAFKLSDRVGVSGTFDQITVVANDGASSMFDVLTGATFEIPTGTLNSQDPVRDPTLKTHFFGNLVNTVNITGSVTEINGTTGKILIKMNDVEKEYEGSVTVDGESITWEGALEITDFNAQTSLDSIGVYCAEKHTGPDGVQKFWTDVGLAVKTTLKKDCPQ